MREWTRDDVAARLEAAARVMRAQPRVGPRGAFNAWPTYFHEFADRVGQEPEMRRPQPSPRAVSEAEEAMGWLQWLEPDDARLVWMRAEGASWKAICWRSGLTRSTAHRRWQYALSVIVWKLKGRRVPTRRSRQDLIARAGGPAAGRMAR